MTQEVKSLYDRSIDAFVELPETTNAEFVESLGITQDEWIAFISGTMAQIEETEPGTPEVIIVANIIRAAIEFEQCRIAEQAVSDFAELVDGEVSDDGAS